MDEQILSKLDEMFSQHENGKVFVTENVYYEMRNVIKRARKNYLGVYENPTDPVTGQEKYWPPLTETFTDGVLKSIDLDLKDVDIYSKNSSKIAATRVYKMVVKEKLRQAGFSTALNMMEQYLVTDGTGTLKFIDDVGPDGKRCMKIVAVDSLNIICDQTADDIHKSFGVLERSLMTQDELRRKAGVWKNIDSVIADTDQSMFRRHSNRIMAQVDVDSVGPVYPVYDYWGQVNKAWITGSESDDGTWVEGHVVVSGLGGDKGKHVLFKELNESGKRPYGECVLKKVIGRRGGRGVPEMLFGTQEYMCMLIEIRKKNAQILQNGLFKAKKGLGLTADSIISKITSGGVIPVNDMDDFQQMPIDDSRAASYQDEDRLLSWGERSTGQFDVRRGESLSASAPATTQLIQDRNSRDLYQLVQENIGLMLEKFLEDHVLPWVAKNVTDGETVSITGSLSELEEYDNAIAEHLVNKAFVEHVERTRQYPTPEELVAAKKAQLKVLARQGKGRYLTLKKDVFTGINAGVRVTITNEEIDKGTILTKLQEMLTLAVSNPAFNLDINGIVDTIFDLIGIPTDRVYTSRIDQPTPIDRLEQSVAQRKEQAAQASQPMNKVSGNVAPQMNSRAGAPGQAGPTRQTADNLTQLAM